MYATAVESSAFFFFFPICPHGSGHDALSQLDCKWCCAGAEGAQCLSYSKSAGVTPCSPKERNNDGLPRFCAKSPPLHTTQTTHYKHQHQQQQT